MSRRPSLQIVFDLFVATGQWPSQKDAERRVAAAGSPPSAISILPERFGGASEGKVVLTVRALRKLPSAADTLDDFLRALRYAGAIYRNWEADPVLDIRTLTSELSLSRGRADRAMALLESEGLIERPPRGDGSEEFLLTSEVGHYATVRSCRSYVRKRSAAQCGPQPLRPFRMLQAWLKGREPSKRDLIIVALLPGLAILAATLMLTGH